MRKSPTYALGTMALLIVWACQGPPPEPLESSEVLKESRQIKVITSGGFSAAFNILGPIFAQATGIELITEYGSSLGGGPESIPVRLARGETADILIMNRPPLDELADSGNIRPETRVDLARSIIGMAVRSGALKPDISTTEAFIRTLRPPIRSAIPLVSAELTCLQNCSLDLVSGRRFNLRPSALKPNE